MPIIRQKETSAVPALVAQGFALHQAGRLDDAEKIYRRILEIEPRHFDGRHLLGVIFQQRGDHGRALRAIELALMNMPDNVLALNNRGVSLKALGRFDEALASYNRALALQPDFVDALINRGLLLGQLGRFEDALSGFDRVIALRPDHPAALFNRGNVLKALRRLAEALASYDRALAVQPDFAEAHSNRASVLLALGQYDEARGSAERALASRPDFAEAHANRGSALHALQRYEDALASYERALALQPGSAEVCFSRGNALHTLRRFDDALASYDGVLALQPDHTAALTNRGVTLHELDRFDAALASYDTAIAARPDLADAHYNAALACLVTGDYRRGWEEHEWRWQTDLRHQSRRDFQQPLWLGDDDIAGKTILLHAEQGLGDTIQFCRYAPLVAARGARVILEVQKPLVTLMASLAGGAQIVARGEALPDFDRHCPLLSLPLAFRTELSTIPAAAPYLAAPEHRIIEWRARLGERRRPRVGLVWAGNPRKQLPNANRIDAQRSLSFDLLQTIFEIGECDFYSLQKGDDAVRQLRESPLCACVIDYTDELDDFSDTAALIECLDLIISVDTSVAHLAGALNRPLWLLNRRNTCWRWLTGRNDSPWYPSARLFRQGADRDWSPVITRVGGALRAWVAGLTPSR